MFILVKVSCFSYTSNNKTNIIGVFQNYENLNNKLKEIEDIKNEEFGDEEMVYKLKEYIPDTSFNKRYNEKKYIVDILNEYHEHKYLIYEFGENEEYNFEGIDCKKYYKLELE